jgi:rod shape-determining protein MreD
MRNLFLGIILLVTFVLQSTFFNYIKIMGVKPDLLLVIVVIYALHNEEKSGGLFGFAAGLLQDIITGKYLGLNSFTKGIIAFFVSHMEQKIYKENIIIPVMLVFTASIGHDVLYYFIRSLVDFNVSLTTAFLGIILPSAVYNSLLVPIIYPKLHSSFTRGLLSRY